MPGTSFGSFIDSSTTVSTPLHPLARLVRRPPKPMPPPLDRLSDAAKEGRIDLRRGLRRGPDGLSFRSTLVGRLRDVWFELGESYVASSNISLGLGADGSVILLGGVAVMMPTLGVQARW